MTQLGPYLVEGEGGFSHNMATLPLKNARNYSERECEKKGLDLDALVPDFDNNYIIIQKALRKAKDIPRIQMPVIEPTDMKQFYNDLKKGSLDILKPYAKGHLEAPAGLERDRDAAEEWVSLGFHDGDPNDDRIQAKWTHIEAKKLLPTQSQIWLEKVIGNIIKFGVPKQGSSVTEQTIIVSKEGYILDGHHRYGQAVIANPRLKLKALFIPVDINTLVKVGRSYGNALGNEQKG